MSDSFHVVLISAPPLSPTKTVLSAVRAIEEISRESLDVLVGMPPKRLRARDAFLRRELSQQNPNLLVIPSLCSRPGGPGYMSILGSVRGPPSQPEFLYAHVTVPSSRAEELCGPLLCRLAEELNAWWGRASGGALSTLVSSQFRPPTIGGYEPPSFKAPRGLPELTDSLDAPSRPYELGWLNWWSPESAELAGLGDPEKSGGVSLIRRDAGGWLIELTPRPLDPTKADDLETLRKAFDRFPGVGRIPKGDREAVRGR